MTSISYEDEDTYDHLVERHQLLKIHCLNDLLKRHKLPLEARKQIINELMFQEGYFFDACWIRQSGIKHFPMLCYGEKADHPEGGFGVVNRLLLPPDATAMHEVVGGVVDTYFEQKGESVADVDCGDEWENKGDIQI